MNFFSTGFLVLLDADCLKPAVGCLVDPGLHQFVRVCKDIIEGKEEVGVDTISCSYGSCGKGANGVSANATAVSCEDERRRWVVGNLEGAFIASLALTLPAGICAVGAGFH